MGKDRRTDKKEENEALGKKADKFGKKGDGKVDTTQTIDKSWTHQTVRHILSQKQSVAIKISEEIHDGKISFNEAAFQYSEDKAGAHGLLGDKAQNEVCARACLTGHTPQAAPKRPMLMLGARRCGHAQRLLLPACNCAARPAVLGCIAHVQGGRLAARAGQDSMGLAPHHGAGADNQEEEVGGYGHESGWPSARGAGAGRVGAHSHQSGAERAEFPSV